MVAEAMRDDDVGWLGWSVGLLAGCEPSIDIFLTSDRHDLGWKSNYYTVTILTFSIITKNTDHHSAVRQFRSTVLQAQ